jgi:hypothetical protein
MNLITGSYGYIFSGALGDLFDTFARSRTDRWITVYKEPIKTIIIDDQNMIAGYDSGPSESSYQLTPVSGTFPAVIIYEYKADNKDIVSDETESKIAKNTVRIKVERDACDYILNGKTEAVIVDGQTFNAVSQYKVQDYIGLKYYYFNLSQTF